jgi:hypothetical protein
LGVKASAPMSYRARRRRRLRAEGTAQPPALRGSLGKGDREIAAPIVSDEDAAGVGVGPGPPRHGSGGGRDAWPAVGLQGKRAVSKVEDDDAGRGRPPEVARPLCRGAVGVEPSDDLPGPSATGFVNTITSPVALARSELAFVLRTCVKVEPWSRVLKVSVRFAGSCAEAADTTKATIAASATAARPRAEVRLSVKCMASPFESCSDLSNLGRPAPRHTVISAGPGPVPAPVFNRVSARRSAAVGYPYFCIQVRSGPWT